MTNPDTPLIRYISEFLAYYKENGYSANTQESYKHYLNQFVLWLKKYNKQAIKPHELTITDISEYKSYLSALNSRKGHQISKITQNHYLIALRALLGYFMAKDVVSILPSKITLLGPAKSLKTTRFLSPEQIKKILAAPNVKETNGLRDRAVLETIIATGFKVKEISSFKINEINKLSPGALFWIKKYLGTRKNKKGSLFALTDRSIERIVSYYGVKSGVPFPVKPELLRWARSRALAEKFIEIKNPRKHKLLLVKNYTWTKNIQLDKTKISHSWSAVEKIINNEIIWLKNSVPVLPENYKENPSFLKHDESILRKLAILIVGGKITATELLAQNDSFWGNTDSKRINWHGQEWHKETMNKIYHYFEAAGHKVALEPRLNHGRADLGIDIKPYGTIFVEVGTVSLFKLWYNLSTMENSTFLIIPAENKIIEFTN